MTKKEFAEIIFAGLKDMHEHGAISLDDVLCFLDEEEMWKIYKVVDGEEELVD